MDMPSKKKKSPKRARKVLEKPQILGWKTSDAEEMELRRWRGRTEIAGIEALEPEYGLFGTFRVHSVSGGAYEVEIRDLAGRTNSCGCIDHRVNGLGSCKHVEGVLASLKNKHGVRAFRAGASIGSPRTEVLSVGMARRRLPRLCRMAEWTRRRMTSSNPSWARMAG